MRFDEHQVQEAFKDPDGQSLAEQEMRNNLTRSKTTEKKGLYLQSAEDLLKKDLPPLEFILDGIIAEQGVYVFAGPYKMGKSWFAMDLSLSISDGQSFLNRSSKKGGVLYLDLETGERSLKSRLEKLTMEIAFPDNWYFCHNISKIGKGFREEISGAIKEKNIKLVVVDVFKKIRSPKAKFVDGYDHDYDDIGVLKSIANELNTAFMIITHTTKMKFEDPLDSVRGSGVCSAADGIILLDRQRLSNEAKVIVTGREFESAEIMVEFNQSKLRWEFIGTSEEVEQIQQDLEYRQNPVTQTILMLLNEQQIWKGYVSTLFNEMMSRVNLEKFSPKDIPETAHKVGDVLRKYIHKFAQEGIKVIFCNRDKRGFPIIIHKN